MMVRDKARWLRQHGIYSFTKDDDTIQWTSQLYQWMNPHILKCKDRDDGITRMYEYIKELIYEETQT